MAELCKPRPSKSTIAELVSKLENINVPDDEPVSATESCEDTVPPDQVDFPEYKPVSVTESPEETVLPDQSVSEDSKTVLQSEDQADVQKATGVESGHETLTLYPKLDDEIPTTDKSYAGSADVLTVPSLASCDKVPTAEPPRECILPEPLDSNNLKNLYLNKQLQQLVSLETNFLKEAINSDSDCVLHNEGEVDIFRLLLSEYTHHWNQWSHAVSRLMKVIPDQDRLEEQCWKVENITAEEKGRCRDRATVCMPYDYLVADYSTENARELAETHEVLRWIVFEELPLSALKVAQFRTKVEGHILKTFEEFPRYLTISTSEPIELLSSSGEPAATDVLMQARSMVTVLFTSLRQHYTSAENGADYDQLFVDQLSKWILLTAGTMLRLCRWEDHLFLLHHLLRLPSPLFKPLVCLIQPPDLRLIWNRQPGDLVYFLHQPEVNLVVSLLATCLRPVRDRHLFMIAGLNLASSRLPGKDGALQSKPQNPWTFVDSGGESDTDDGNLSPSETAATSSVPAGLPSDLFPPTLLNRRGCLSTEAGQHLTALSPHDLDRVIRQLNIDQLFKLLTLPDGTSDPPTVITADSGLMTLLAFADRLMHLLEACALVYDGIVSLPNPQSQHLASWRLLAKRLSSLVRHLVTAVSGRVHRAWRQSAAEQLHDLHRLLAQYDAFCLRAVTFLLSGCGLPSAHRGTVRLVAWRHLASILPLNLVSSRAKVALFDSVVASILDAPPSSAGHVQVSRLASCLRVRLLWDPTTSLNEKGLDAVMTVLGRLAALECRPIPGKGGVLQLPVVEADLVQSIVRLLFALSISNADDQSGSSPVGVVANSDCPDPLALSSSSSRRRSRAFQPVSPESARRQLVDICTRHPQVCVVLLYRLVLDTGFGLAESQSAAGGGDLRTRWLPLSAGVRTEMEGNLKSTQLLLQLISEAPLHLLRPTAEDLEPLFRWLVDQPLGAFLHTLARSVLQQLSWESLISLETGEPFIAASLHFDMAINLCKVVQKHRPSPGSMDSIVSHPVMTNVWMTALATASSAKTRLLSAVGLHQSRCEQRGRRSVRFHTPSIESVTDSKASLQQRSSRWRSQEPVSSRRSRSGSRAGIDDRYVSLLSWAIGVLLRLHLPGCSAPIHPPGAPVGDQEKAELSQAYTRLTDQFNPFDQPLAAFVLLSLHGHLFETNRPLPDLPHLSRLLLVVVKSGHFSLVLRALFLVFHYSSASPSSDQQVQLTEAVGETLKSLLAISSCDDDDKNNEIRREVQLLVMGSCLDVCLRQSFTCSGLLKSLVNTVTPQRTSLTEWWSVNLLDQVIAIDVWLQHKFIPNQCGQLSSLQTWTLSELSLACQHVLITSFDTPFDDEPAQSHLAAVGAVARLAWSRSYQAFDAISSRLTGGRSTSLCHAGEQACGMSPPKLASLLSLIGRRQEDEERGCWWLVTTLLVAEFNRQAAPDGVWYRIARLLSRHTDELLTVDVDSVQVDGVGRSTLSPSLRVLLERVLIEAELIPVGEGSSSASEDAILAVLSRLFLAQGLALVLACPLVSLVFPLLLHAFLSQTFNLTAVNQTTDDVTGPSASPFPVAFLLLRRLPAGLATSCSGRSGSVTPVSTDKRQSSMLHLLLEKVKSVSRLPSTIPAAVGSSSRGHLHDGAWENGLLSVAELLTKLDATASRNFTIDRREVFRLVNRTHCRQVIDNLLNLFDWPALSSQLQFAIDLWNQHRVSTSCATQLKVNSQLAMADPAGSVRLQVYAGLDEREPRCALSKHCLNTVLANRLSNSLPTAPIAYPQHMQKLCHLVSEQSQFLCDCIDRIAQLQTDLCENLLPKLYTIIVVRKSDKVECRSILPSWAPGYRPCSGGVRLSCEYRTAQVNTSVEGLCRANRTDVHRLIRVFTHRALCCASTGLLLLPEEENCDEGGKATVSLAQLCLQLQAAVSQLIALSTEQRSAVFGARGTSQPKSPRHLGHGRRPGDRREGRVAEVGVQCFQLLCRLLSGPLLRLPATKQLLAQCIEQLADEFLVSPTASYELVLDMLVALPHLAGLLLPAFTVPHPSEALPAPEEESDEGTVGRRHPLTAVYSRLIDIRLRCSPADAFNILRKIDVSTWSATLASYPNGELLELLHALVDCIQVTGTADADSPDRQLHEGLLGHLHHLLKQSFPNLLLMCFDLLLLDVFNSKLAPVWTTAHAVIMADLEDNSTQSSLSIEQLMVLLNKIADRLSQPAPASPADSDSWCPLGGTVYEGLLHHREAVTHLPTLLSVSHTLLSVLARKLGQCVASGHLSVVYAASAILDFSVYLFGSVPLVCAALESSTITGDDGGEPAVSLVQLSLRYLSEVLCIAITAGDSWSQHLLDTLIVWFLSSVCTNVLVDHPALVDTASPGSRGVCPGTPAPGVKVTQRSAQLGLPVILVHHLSLADAHGLGLSLPWRLWTPSLSALQAMVELILATRAQSPSTVTAVASYCLHLLLSADWSQASAAVTAAAPVTSWTFGRRVLPQQRQSLAGLWLANGRPSDFADALVYLLVLLAQSLYTGSTSKVGVAPVCQTLSPLRITHSLGARLKVRNDLQHLLETASSSFDLSSVEESAYRYILAQLSELWMPAYCALMPPTCLEGRLFGLLAVAGCMTAGSLETRRSRNAAHRDSSPRQQLYPSLSEALTTADSPSRSAAQRKRTVYVQTLTELMRIALLRGPTGPTPSLADHFKSTAVPHLFMSSTSGDPGAAEGSTGPQTWSSTLHRLTLQPAGSLLKRIVAGVRGIALGVTLGDEATENLVLDDQQQQQQQHQQQEDAVSLDPSRILTGLAWLRLGNLLSELEAVAASVSWGSIDCIHFTDMADLCQQVINVLTSGGPRLSQVDDPPAMSGTPSSTGQQSQAGPLTLAVIHWLLGVSESNQHPMPRSINAGLARPIGYAVLVRSSAGDPAGTRRWLVRLLEAVIWSVLAFAPNSMSTSDRFDSLEALFVASLTGNDRSFLHNGLAHTCCEDSICLPLALLALARLRLLESSRSAGVSADSTSILAADLAHWFDTCDPLLLAVEPTTVMERMVRLYGWCILMNLLLRTVIQLAPNRTVVASDSGHLRCCPQHPVWMLEAQSVAGSGGELCPAVAYLTRLVQTLWRFMRSLVKAIGQRGKQRSSVELYGLNRLLTFVKCFGYLLETYLGATNAGPTPFSESLSPKLSSLSLEDALNTDGSEVEDRTFSILQTLIARLPRMHLSTAFIYLCSNIWPELSPLLTHVFSSW